jgi:hypothetical protein
MKRRKNKITMTIILQHSKNYWHPPTCRHLLLLAVCRWNEIPFIQPIPTLPSWRSGSILYPFIISVSVARQNNNTNDVTTTKTTTSTNESVWDRCHPATTRGITPSSHHINEFIPVCFGGVFMTKFERLQYAPVGNWTLIVQSWYCPKFRFEATLRAKWCRSKMLSCSVTVAVENNCVAVDVTVAKRDDASGVLPHEKPYCRERSYN